LTNLYYNAVSISFHYIVPFGTAVTILLLGFPAFASVLTIH